MNTNGTRGFILFSLADQDDCGKKCLWEKYRYRCNMDLSSSWAWTHSLSSKLPLDPLVSRGLMYTSTPVSASPQDLSSSWIGLPWCFQQPAFPMVLSLDTPWLLGHFAYSPASSYPDHPTAGPVKSQTILPLHPITWPMSLGNDLPQSKRCSGDLLPLTAGGRLQPCGWHLIGDGAGGC